MDESTMHDLLSRACGDEPPLGSLVSDAVRGGRRLRCRRRVGGGLVAGLAVLAMVTGISYGVNAVRRPVPVAAPVVPASPVPSPTPAPAPEPIWPDITPDPVVAAAEIKLPIDRYRLTTAQFQEYVFAGYVRAGECMRRFGFAYDLTPDLVRMVGAAQARVAAFGQYGNLRAWGVTDATLAKTYGYHISVVLVKPTKVPDFADIRGLGPLTPTKLAVLTGVNRSGKSPGKVNGLPVPKGGCAAEAGPAAPPVRSGIVDKVELASDRLAETDVRIVEAMKSWSGCMREHGYRWSQVSDAGSDLDIDTPEATAPEKKEAAADVACKESSGYTATVVEVLTSYQNAQIAAYPAEFDEVAAENREIVAASDRAITVASR